MPSSPVTDGSHEHSWASTKAKERGVCDYLQLLLREHGIEDVRKDPQRFDRGHDFYVIPATAPYRRIACDDKVDYHNNGNIAVEVVSHGDAPGWLFTSACAFVFYWLMQSAELVVLPMDMLRTVALQHWARAKAASSYTPAWRQRSEYVTWNLLFPADWLLLHVHGARFVDLAYEVGMPRNPGARNAVTGQVRMRHGCSPQALVEHMLAYPDISLPLPADPDELHRMMRTMARNNIMAGHRKAARVIEGMPEDWGVREAHRHAVARLRPRAPVR
jgi:hypothetical protein